MQLSEKQIVKIKQVISLDAKRKIVRIDVSHKNEGWSNDESNRNIYCIDDHHNVFWQVNELTSEVSAMPGGVDPFYYIGKNEKNEIIADRFSGFIYEIDPETGMATRIGFHK